MRAVIHQVTHVVSSSCEEARGLPGLLRGGCWALPRAYFEACLRERRLLREENFAFAVGMGMQADGAQPAPAAAPAEPHVSEADSVSVTMLHCADQEAEPQRGGQALPGTSTANAAAGAPTGMAAPASDAALRPGTDIWGLPYDQGAAEAALKALRENYAPMNRQGSALSAAHQASAAAVAVVVVPYCICGLGEKWGGL